jgi:iron complex outermembrane receptor protein
MMRKSVYRTGLILFGSISACYAASPALAQATAPSAQDAQSQSAQDDENVIIVTATKRPEAVRDISGSITAMTGDQLERLGASSMAGYLTRTPGVVFNAGIPGASTVIIRGVSTSTGGNQSQNTTGIFINDVPLTDPTFSIGEPDIDTFDVDNVAILRGPQGTLFGSATLGGAVNYQAAKPDLNDWQGRIQGTVQDTGHGGTGGAAKVMLNAPIFRDTLAVRGVFSYRKDAGYIDNVGTGERDVNRTVTKSGRVLATWKPGPNTTLNYLYLEQSQVTDDIGYQQPGIGKLLKSTPVPERARYETLVHNLRIDQDLSFATLVGTATYHRKAQNTVGDLSALGPVLEGGLGVAFAPILTFGPGKSEGETFEVRLVSAPGGKFDYVVGAFYDQTRLDLSQIIYAGGLAGFLDVAGPFLGLPAGAGQTIAPNDLLADLALPARSKEMALFGEASYHFTDQFKLTAGGRFFKQKFSNASDSNGFFVLLVSNPPTLSQFQSGTQKADGFNPKVSVTWTPNDDLMLYALASKGFRFGGANLSALPGVKPTYGSDSLWNYEAGMRADLWDRKLLLDLTAFYIDWSNIQLNRRISGVNFLDNAGAAQIRGLEASLTLRPTHGLSLTSNLTYLDAHLSEIYDADPSDPTNPVIPSGTRLPGASKWQISNTANYDFPIGSLESSLVLSHRYISRAPSDIEALSSQGGFHNFDARFGVRKGRYGVTLFVDNIGDSRGVTASTADPFNQYLLRPRTIGVTFDARL